MLNPKLKLNPKLFSENCEKISTRKGFGEGLLRAGTEDSNIVGLSADLKESTQMIFFAEKFPERYVEIGVAEQNLVTVASGLAAMGKIPFCSSYAMFSPGRNWEQIRTSIAYNNRPVKIIGSHAGLSVGPDGGSHQALEDIALMKVIPNMEVFSPCDAIEAKKITEEIAKNKMPTYLRLYRDKTPIITTEETFFDIDKAEIFWLPEVGLAQVGIITTGTILYEALLAARELEKENIKVKIMNLFSIKPLDEEAIIKLAKETKAILTIEDHQKIGGMGSSVAEILAQNYPVPIEFIGIEDRFGQSGTSAELYKEYKLDKDFIKQAIKKILVRKN
jgi:transketolase